MTEFFIHDYRGYNHFPSKCEVKIISDDGEHLICFTDLGMGTSVTTASEQLATEIVKNHNFNPNDCRFFEAYDHGTFDEIEYEWGFNFQQGNWVATNPKWLEGDEKLKDVFTIL